MDIFIQFHRDKSVNFCQRGTFRKTCFSYIADATTRLRFERYIRPLSLSSVSDSFQAGILYAPNIKQLLGLSVVFLWKPC